ncbi:MAG: hypothetical protein KDA42_05175 [Planctomycetales bacterium]|nr:hypothetical protein [Planctomycetales bacterium]
MKWVLLSTEFILLALAIFMIRRHFLTWKKYEHDRDQREQNFRWNQFRRRLQISGSLGLAAVLLFLTQLMTSLELIEPALFFGSALGLVILWFLILAISDFFVTRKHVAMMRDIKEVEGTSLPGGIKHRTTRDGRKLTLKLDPEEGQPLAGESGSSTANDEAL